MLSLLMVFRPFTYIRGFSRGLRSGCPTISTRCLECAAAGFRRILLWGNHAPALQFFLSVNHDLFAGRETASHDHLRSFRDIQDDGPYLDVELVGLSNVFLRATVAF